MSRTVTMALVRADEDAMEIVSSFRIEGERGPFRARPAIFNGRLYVTHGDALMVYNLRGQEGEMRAADSQQISENTRTDK